MSTKNTVKVVHGSEVAEVAVVRGSTIGDVLEALGIKTSGMQIKVGQEKKTVSCAATPGQVILLIPHVVAG
jgi:hypothetical protein